MPAGMSEQDRTFNRLVVLNDCNLRITNRQVETSFNVSRSPKT